MHWYSDAELAQARKLYPRDCGDYDFLQGMAKRMHRFKHGNPCDHYQLRATPALVLRDQRRPGSVMCGERIAWMVFSDNGSQAITVLNLGTRECVDFVGQARERISCISLAEDVVSYVTFSGYASH